MAQSLRRIALLLSLVLASAVADAQVLVLERLSADRLDVMSPSVRVEGRPGEMRIRERACRARAADDTRRRIDDNAKKEWGSYGFNVAD
jgi:hypothetical protein